MSQVLVAYEDTSLVVFDKPSGLLTIPGRDPRSASLWRLAEAQRQERLWPVHRLDRETSGLVLFARSAAIHRTLNAAFEARRIQKRYLAQVSPPPAAREGHLEHALVAARRGFMRVAREATAGALAQTDYRVLEIAGERALVELHPITGRTHQLRLQLATLGSPIVGEPHYRSLQAGASPPLPAARLWLHASRLELDHPLEGTRLRIEAPSPAGLWPPA